MKKLLLGFIVAATAMVMMTPCVLAATATVNGIEWTYTVSDGKASISDVPEKTTGAITIPSSLGGYPVTSIGEEAFYDCDGLTSVTIGNSVTSIGDDAFRYCWNLTSVTIGNSVTSIGSSAFFGCSGLTSVTIPNRVTSIGSSAFSYCSGLTSFIVDSNNPNFKSVNGLLLSKDGKTLIAGINCNVVIPDSVTSIGEDAFYLCSGLTSVTIPDSVTSIGKYAFDGCRGLTSVTIGNSVTSIEYRAFSDCSSLESFIVDSNNPNYKSVNGLLLSKDGKTLIAGINGNVVVPNSVTSIGSYAFEHCSGLTSVTIPDSVTSIGDVAFWDCDGLTSVTIPDSVTSIGNGAFGYCDGLTSVMIPDSVTSIGDRAFEGCSGLIKFIVDSNNPNYKSVNGLLLSKDGKTLIAGINGNVVIPDSVTSIGEFAFCSCSLTSITIPDSVTSIGDSAFYGCNDFLYDTTTIQGVKLVDGWVVDYTDSCPSVLYLTGIRGIGACAFEYCRGLTGITIPNSVTSIGEYAFNGCSGLTSVTIPDSVTSIGSLAFSDCNSLLFDTTTIQGVKLVDGWVVGYTDSCPSVLDLTGIRGIGGRAFEYCRGLTSVTIPQGVTSIGDSAFWNCWGLTSVTIPDSVTSIGEGAFSWCYDLKSAIFLGDAPRDVGDDIFQYCADDFVIKVTKGTKGWDGDYTSTVLPATWHGYPIEYATESDSSSTNDNFEDAYTLTGIKGDTTGKNVEATLQRNEPTPSSQSNSGASVWWKWTAPATGTVVFDTIDSDFDTILAVYIGSSLSSLIEVSSDDDNGGGYTSRCEFDVVSGTTYYIAVYGYSNNKGDIYLNWDLRVDSEDDEIEWKYRVVNGEAEIYGGDWTSAIPETTTGAVTIPSSLGGYHVTSIGDYAFYDCSGLTSVTIPDSVTSIGEGAFDECSGLTSITIPDSVTSIGEGAFYCCSGLTSVTIPASVTSIGEEAFWYCSGLTSVTIPDSVTSIGVSAFYNCSSLTSVEIPDSVTSIGWDAFYCCSGLTSVTIGDSVTSIGSSAFSGCSGLTSFIVDSNNPNYKSVNGLLLSKDGKTLIAGIKGNIVIPDGVTSIGDSAFRGCSGLTNVTIPDSVTSIGYNAFRGCSGLTNVTIPDSVTSIGWDAFSWCSGLTKFIVDSNNPNYKSVNSLLLTKDGKTLIAGIKGNIVIPDGVTSIGSWAFCGCDDLTSVTIPDSVTIIGYEAFRDCDGLTSVMIPDSVTIIGNWAFYGCSYLKSAIFLGDAPRDVGNGIFDWCAGDFVIKVKKGTKGWDGDYTSTDLPATWHGYPIEYATESELNVTYKVVFNANGGSGSMAAQTMTYNVASKLRSNAFKRTGYTFQGWAKSKTGAVAYKNGASVKNLATSGTVTIYAVWKPNTYKVAFYANGGTGSMSAQSMTYNKAAYLKNNAFKRTGYTFLGWAKSPTGAVAYKNAALVKNLSASGATIKLYAKWAKTKYKIAFYANGGKGTMSAQTMTYNKAAYLKKNTFKRTGYTFQGWAKTKNGAVAYKNGQAVKNLTTTGGTVKLYAKWKPITYKIAFYANGGSGSMSAQSMTYNKAAYLKKNAFKRTGYTFQGWAKSAKGAVVYKNGKAVKNLRSTAGTVKLYAKWKPITYKVVFYPNGGSGKAIAQSMTYNKAAYLKKNIYKRSGYIFLGWAKSKNGAVAYKNAQAVKNLRSTKGTIKLYAVWAKTTYKVAFYANGGSGSMSAQSMTYNKAAYLKKNTFKRTGYTFAGWAKSSTGSVVYSNGKAVKNLTRTGGTVKLYAKWKQITCKIIFHPNGGFGSSVSQTLTYKKSANLRSNTFTRTGYTFAGWATSAYGDVEYEDAMSVIYTGTTSGYIFNLYAVWKFDTSKTHNGHKGVQLWSGGPYWATTNIGAENPEDYGYYFWWGDTIGYKRVNDQWVASDGSLSNFSFKSKNTPTAGKDISELLGEGWITLDEVLVPEHDAASVHWGGQWRMPTKDELNDLNRYCTWKKTILNGVYGYAISGKDAYSSAKIFLPIAGRASGTSLSEYDNLSGGDGGYWSSVPANGGWSFYIFFNFGSHRVNQFDWSRTCGYPVRPVIGY